MATPAATTTGQTPVRDIAPPSGQSSGRSGTQRSFEGEMLRARRTAQSGVGRSRNLIRSLLKLHKDTAEIFDQKQSKHVQELSKATLTALQNIKKPSTIRHGFDIALCIFIDTVAMAALTALILGGAVSAGAATAAGVAASILIAILMWPTERIILGKSAKKNTEHRKELQKNIEQVKQDIEDVKEDYEKFRKWAKLAAQRYPQVAAKLTSTGARIGRSAKVIKPIGKAISWLTKFLKNPAVKGTAESVPFVQIVPWWTMGAIASWIANRAEYKEAQRLLTEYSTAKREVYGITGDMYQTQLAVVEQELVEKTIKMREQESIAAA